VDFELLDGYLLDGLSPKAQVVQELLASRPEAPGARPFYEGMQRLGARTPDLIARARAGDAAAREEYNAIGRPET
jgi:hypothetical protein